MKKKTNKTKTLRNKADKLFQQIGRKENTHCIICGRDYNCLHHYITKASSSALRYDFDNAIPICVSCHMGIHSRYDPRVIELINIKKGVDWAEKLNDKRREPVKVGVKYYEGIIEKLEKRLKA